MTHQDRIAPEANPVYRPPSEAPAPGIEDAAETAANKARREAWAAYRANQIAQREHAEAETARMERSAVPPSSIVVLALCIAGSAIAIVVALVTATTISRVGKAEAAIAQMTNAANTESCAAPAKAGDSAIITVRHAGDRLLTRCQQITDWRAPERAKP